MLAEEKEGPKRGGFISKGGGTKKKKTQKEKNARRNWKGNPEKETKNPLKIRFSPPWGGENKKNKRNLMKRGKTLLGGKARKEGDILRGDYLKTKKGASREKGGFHQKRSRLPVREKKKKGCLLEGKKKGGKSKKKGFLIGKSD